MMNSKNNNFVTPLLSDYYQFTMAYSYWKMGRHDLPCIFDLYIRKNPFGGAFTVFAGLSACIEFLQNYKFCEEDISYLKEAFGIDDPEFYEWISTLDVSRVKVYALKEGTITFPHVPFMRIEGPLAICQLLETTLLNLVNFASLVTTNAVRMRLAAGDKKLLEFGLRRAQGPDGGMTASRYSFLAGFHATSNVKASQVYNIPVKGTHAHAFVSSFRSLKDLQSTSLFNKKTGEVLEYVPVVIKYLKQLNESAETNEGELAAFIAYSISWPNNFTVLIDTYNTLKSGLVNFCAVALALIEFGYDPIGIRLDSGDLSYLSIKARAFFVKLAEKYNIPEFAKLNITASNEIDEETLLSLNSQGHEVDTFGIGTNLVTCKNQTALGGVYKLVEIDGQPCLKLSQEISKVSIPGKKIAYRLYNVENVPMLDLLCSNSDTDNIKVGEKIMCRHPFLESKRVYVIPSHIEKLHHLFWDGNLVEELPTDNEIREYINDQIKIMRPDHLRHLNPTPYKVSLTQPLYETFHDLWLSESTIEEIK